MESLPIADDQQARVLDRLRHCELFRALKDDQLPQLLKAAELLRYDNGEALVRQGAEADSFFVLVEGEVAVTVDKGGEPVEIGRVPSPASVGEVSLLLNEKRTASLTAVGEVQALKFASRAFEAMFQKIPQFGQSLATGLAQRVNQLSGKVSLPRYDARQGRPSPETVALLPLELVQRHRVLPLKMVGNQLTVGLVDEPSSAVITAVRQHVPGVDVHTLAIDGALFNEVLSTLSATGAWKLREAAAGPVTRKAAPALDELLHRMVAEGASDVHVSAGHRPRWRIDGEMAEIADAAVLGPEEAYELLAPAMDERHKREFAEANDSDLGYEVPGLARFRVNVFRDQRGAGAVLRQIPSKIMSFEQLGLPPALRAFCEIPKGLVLVTGPTGSGKSTTLAAMIDYINRTRRQHIITLEDPIEFVHPSQQCLVNQREVGGHTRSFSRALRAVLREDPDIVLVGEMRDPETVALALETANTGHLVFATLHTNTAISSVDRVIDQFPGEQQDQVRSVLSDVLRGVVCQTLCRKIGGGRVAALEVLVVNVAAANLIREHKTVQITSVMQSGKAAGNALLNDTLAQLVEEKKVDLAEALSKAVDKEDLAKRFRVGLKFVDDPNGLKIVSVQPNSPSAEIGLSRGDVILEIDTRPAKEFSVEEAKQTLRLETKHPLVVLKDGKRVKLVLDMTKR